MCHDSTEDQARIVVLWDSARTTPTDTTDSYTAADYTRRDVTTDLEKGSQTFSRSVDVTRVSQPPEQLIARWQSDG